MQIHFKNYELADLEEGLTIRHPLEGWPVWIPVLGIRAWFNVREATEFWTSLTPVYDRFVGAFRDQLVWQQGFSSKRPSKIRADAAIPQLPFGDVRAWELKLNGPGEETKQASRCSFRTSGVLHPKYGTTGHIFIAIPLDRFLQASDTVQLLLADLGRVVGLEVGFAGICGAGTPDYQSHWNDSEFFILQNYLGIDPSEDAQLGIDLGSADGYSHAGQWISILGQNALARLGGAEVAFDAAIRSGLDAKCAGQTLLVQAGDFPDSGVRNSPTRYQLVDSLLKPNQGSDFFIGHGFSSFGKSIFGAWGVAADRWMHRFEPGSEWVAKAKEFSGIEIEYAPGNVPQISPLA